MRCRARRMIAVPLPRFWWGSRLKTSDGWGPSPGTFLTREGVVCPAGRDGTALSAGKGCWLRAMAGACAKRPASKTSEQFWWFGAAGPSRV